jgi:DNA polymerase III delta prime subunit
MARMVPELDEAALQAHRPKCEADAYRALRDHTPADWLVVFDEHVVAQPGGQAAFVTEVDLVVFAVGLGLLLIEMKGGLVTIDDATRIWTSISDQGRGSAKRNPDPTKSMLAALKTITSKFRKARGLTRGDPKSLLTGHAYLFPDMPDVAQFANTTVKRPLEILGSQSDFADLESWIRKVFDFWAQDNQEWQPLDDQGMLAAQAVFASQIRVKRPLAQVLEGEHETQDIELTRQQSSVVRGLILHPRALIAGGAGTGKTLIALYKAKELAKEGRKTLFVCFNRALSDFLDRNCRDIPNLDAITWDMLISRRLGALQREHGDGALEALRREQPAGTDDEVLQAYMVARTTEMVAFRYQAIIVDEGQDFPRQAFRAMQKLLEDQQESPWYIFYDSNQALYQRNTTYPLGVRPYVLTRNCRNTRYIHEAAYAFFGGEHVSELPEVDGECLVLLSAPTLQEQSLRIREQVELLIHEERLTPDQIVVLIAGSPVDSYKAIFRAQGPFRGGFWSLERHWAKRGVTVDTVRRFKGLEAVTVILWGLEDVPTEIARELLYVALSRSRSRVWLVGDGPRVMQVLRQAAVDLEMLQRALPRF